MVGITNRLYVSSRDEWRAWLQENLDRFAHSYKKQYIWWITSAKKEETRAKIVRETISRAEQEAMHRIIRPVNYDTNG